MNIVQKGSAGIVVLVVFILIIAGVFFYLGQHITSSNNSSVTSNSTLPTPARNPSPTPSEKLSHYVNKVGNYSFDYPEFLTVSEYSDAVSLTNPQDKSKISISASQSSGIDSIDQYLKISDKISNTETLYYSKEITIDGVKAVRRYEKDYGSGTESDLNKGQQNFYEIEHVYAFANQRVFEIDVFPRAEKMLSILETVLSSFKFKID
jgi:hypothetical protein